MINTSRHNDTTLKYEYAYIRLGCTSEHQPLKSSIVSHLQPPQEIKTPEKRRVIHRRDRGIVSPNTGPLSDGRTMKDPRNKSEKKRKRKAIPAAENQPLLPAMAEDIGSIGGTDTTNRKTKTVDEKNSKKSKRRKNEEICSTMAAAKAGVSSISTQRLELTLSCTSKVAEFEHSSRSSNGASVKGIKPREAAKKKGACKKRRREKQPSSLLLEDKNDRSCSVYDASLSRNPGGDKVDDDDSMVGGDDDDDISLAETLEGIVYEELMYLVDSQRNVFSAERNALGEPVRVGVLDEQGRVVLQVSQSNDADAPANTIESSTSKGAVKKTPRKRKEKKKKKKRSVGTEETVAAAAAAAATATANGADDGETGARGTIGSSLSPREKPVEIVEYPFDVEECDHCETSERAYADIAPLLKALAGELGKVPEELSIYDPYYCQGSTAGRLAALGFSRVYNRKEDFYEVVEKDEVPAHDVVVTNPPFSGDNVSKILRFCSRRGAKPWFLLLPNFVYLKDYYEPSLTSGSRGRPALPFFLTPPKRYMFYSPQGSRLNIKSSERKTSPFNTFWYIRLGDPPITSKILTSFEETSRQSESYERCCIARTPSQIPFKMMDSNDPLRKKARDRQRSIERIRKKKSAWADA